VLTFPLAFPPFFVPLTIFDSTSFSTYLTLITLSSLALCVLLAALDSTIVSTALSTIQRDLDGTSASLTWITQSYLLLCTCLAPSYGKISQLYGRKVVLFSSIGFFLFGSLLCATAQNMIWLCAARGVQGIGGGGIVQMTQVVISDVTPLHSRGKYTSVIGSTWGEFLLSKN
jgi:MFS family permease